jgi:hypothetical protein
MTAEGLLSPASFDQGMKNFTLKEGKIAASEIRDIIDWPQSERDNYELGTVNFVPNAYLYGALLAAYDLTGDGEYLSRAAELKKAIRKHFLKNGFFCDSADSEHTAIHSALFALYYDLAESEEEIQNCKEVILSRGMACSVYGAHFLLETCFRYGLEEHALALMTSHSTRSWNNMLKEGATISMETWSDSGKNNQDWCPPWGAAPANIIPRQLCGIRPTAPGFTRFTVDPRPGTLESFVCVQPTLHGPVTLKYQAGTGYELTVPERTSADFRGKIFPAGTYQMK